MFSCEFCEISKNTILYKPKKAVLTRAKIKIIPVDTGRRFFINWGILYLDKKAVVTRVKIEIIFS